MGRLKDFYHDEIAQESLDYEPSEKKETSLHLIPHTATPPET